MSGIIEVINKTYEILTHNYLRFGEFSFTLFAVMLSFGCIGLTAWFVGRLFESR